MKLTRLFWRQTGRLPLFATLLSVICVWSMTSAGASALGQEREGGRSAEGQAGPRRSAEGEQGPRRSEIGRAHV